MSRLSLSLLGPKQILLDGKPVRAFTYQKALALLAYLAVEADVPHSRQELAGLLWPDLSTTSALTNLRQALADLRQVLADDRATPPFLLITRESIQWNGDSDLQFDVTSFRQLLSTCDSHRHRHLDRCRLCQARLDAAIELYRGDFLGGFSVEGAAPFEDWVAWQREQLHTDAQQCLTHLVNYELRCRNDEKAQRYLRRQAELEPWHEEAHQQLMLLYARHGQRSQALAQFEICQRILRAELGVEPSPATQKLYIQIRDGLSVAEESNARPPHYWYNLPLASTSLVGRGEELRQLAELLATPAHRLITILGPGGIGKTRLALAAAVENAVVFRNGVLFVSLAGVGDAHFVSSAIIAVLDVPLPAHRTPQEQVLTFLRDQELLLLLDNYEQLLPDVTFLTHLLRSAPGVTVLVTSRARLAMQAEYLFEITGLAYPASASVMSADADMLGEYSALQLFAERARQVQRNFGSNPEEMTAILRIGRITEGMPLALELAAAALRSHSCMAIAAALESGQQLLSTQMRDVPERQRSMQAVFVHSVSLLSADEVQAFCALSVFRGGFQAEAAQAVVNLSPELLVALVDKSLLRYQVEAADGGRYQIHELLRQYADKKLEETSEHKAILSAHSAYFLQLAEEAASELYGAQQKVWLDRLAREHDNFRAALSHCLVHAPEVALLLASSLHVFWYLGGRLNEGRSWLAQALARSEAIQTVTRGRALLAAGDLAWIQGDFEGATSLATTGLNLFHLLDDLPQVASALNLLGSIHLFKNELNQARSLFEQAIALRRQLGNQAAIAQIVINLGLVAMYQHNYPQAKSLLEESLANAQLTNNQIFAAVCLANLGYLEVYFGHLREATPYLRDAVGVSLSHGDQETVLLCLEAFAETAGAALENPGSLQTAASLFGTAQTFRNLLAIPLPPMDRPFYESNLARLRAHMSEADFGAAWAAGAAMSLERAVAYALSGQLGLPPT